MSDLQVLDSEDEGGVPATMTQVESSRAMQEIQAAVISAKRFPRDTIQAHRRIMDACKRKSLAEQAMYAYPRGGQTVTGPSIRMAEVLAQNWGNLSTGITELEQTPAESVMMAYCVDLETNYRKAVVFNVKNERHTKKGVTRLTDPRDIYENNFNLGSRRLRACILAVIPGDIIEEAITTCEKTLAGDKSEPLADRIRKMAKAFESVGVGQEMLEKKVGKKLDAFLAVEVVNMGKIYKSLFDGMTKIPDWFEVSTPNTAKESEVTEKYKNGNAKTETKPAEAGA